MDQRNTCSGRALSAVIGILVVGGGGIAWWSLLKSREPIAEFNEVVVKAAIEVPRGAVAEEELLLEPVLEEPGLHDEEFMASEGEPDFLSDSPFDDTSLNDVITIGGGAGGSYGSRFGGRRNLGSEAALQAEKLQAGVRPESSGEEYVEYPADAFRSVLEHPLSTFSIDVDRASYTNARRMIDKGRLPLQRAVRVEEFINAFDYQNPVPQGEAPLGLGVEVASCPWRPENRLVRVSLGSRTLDEETRQSRNLVFLVDVSGSMSDADKLPLVKRGLKLLVGALDERDTICIVTYASGTRVVLEPTRGDRKQLIHEALDQLEAGGSTNGSGGIQLAYERAAANFIEGGVNRVLLGTDGDFNVGLSSRSALVELIQQKAESGVFLTVLGFGEGNLKDATLEQIANKGNGHYLYVDSLREARRVFVEELGANLVTVAKDVKLQIEFNPTEVEAYRLVGYVNRKLSARDFNDDRVDAGEVGAGHGVTAFYEVRPARGAGQSGVDELRYQSARVEPSEAAHSGELLTVKLRYKLPEADVSQRLSLVARDQGATFAQSSADFRFGVAVGLFGELLLGSPHVAEQGFDDVLALLDESSLASDGNARTEFFDLVSRALELAANEP